MKRTTKLLTFSTLIIASLMLAMCFFVAFLSEDVYADGFKVTLVDDSDHATPIGSIDETTEFTLDQVRALAEESVGYDYEYYILDDLQPGQRGAKIDADTPVPVTGDMFVIRVATIQTFDVKIFKNSMDDTEPIEINDIEYHTNIKSQVLSKEAVGKYYVYENDIDVEIESDLNILRLDAYYVLVYDNGEPSVKIDDKIIAQTGSLNLTQYSNDSRYDYAYYYYDIANSEMKGKVTSLNTKLSENGYIVNDEIKFIQVKTLLEFTLSNNFDANTKKVVFSEPYGTLFANPIKAGYDFAGWYYNKQHITAESIVETKADHQLEAKFVPKQYVVTIDKQNGETIEHAQVVFNNSMNIPNPTKTGYVFLGWKYGNDSFDPSRPYSIPDNITIKANWVPIEYEVSYYIGEELITKKINYDSENVSLSSDQLEALKENNIVFGLTYLTDKETKLLVNSSLTIAKWNYLTNFAVEVIYMPKVEEYLAEANLPNTYGSDLYIEFDGVKQEAALTSKQIGYHTLIVKNSADEAVYEKQVLIKENFTFEDGVEYDSPIYLSTLDATVIVDNEEVNLLDYRIDKNGTHTITVLGANGYTSTYVITYKNTNILKAWILFAVAMGIALGVGVLALFGRRKVVRYDTPRE